MRRVHSTIGPANEITLVRAGLVAVVAMLVALDLTGHGSRRATVAVAAVALLLDAVDGAVARRTGTVTAAGARFDMETDAALVAVLSVAVAVQLGWWVLLIGAARYLLWVASALVWWLQEPTPPRYRAKVVAAVQGVVLTTVAAEVLPRPVAVVAVAGALVLLTESFGHQVLWLWRHRPDAVRESRAMSVAAVLVVWGVLVLPYHPTQLTPSVLLRVPLELGLLLALVVVLPRLPRAVTVAAGMLLAVVLLVKAADLGFRTVFARPVDPLNDWRYLGPGVGVLRDQSGLVEAVVVVAAAVGLLATLLVVVPLALLRVTRVAERHRRRTAWVAAAVVALQLIPLTASASAASVTYGTAVQLRHDVADRAVFAREIGRDQQAGVATSQLLSGLRGKDVVLVFVESYGRVAVQGSSFSPAVDRTLDQGTAQLQAAGFSARSAFLRSPTFGAGSWLAHSTLQTGLWVDTQQRYDQLMQRRRTSLSSAFHDAGWRTVLDEPADTSTWKQGVRFYGVDHDYTATQVGYRGPSFSYARIPDQYTFQALADRELTPGHRAPVMAEVDLVSSHHPWTPLPHLVPWDELGDGSIYAGQAAAGESADEAFRHPSHVKALYGRSIVYSWQSLVGFVQRANDPNLVLVVLGDHQPHTYVSGEHVGHDVPVSIIARDPAVLDRTTGWGWESGLRPHPDAPVWRMDAFRDRFLRAFS